MPAASIRRVKSWRSLLCAIVLFVPVGAATEDPPIAIGSSLAVPAVGDRVEVRVYSSIPVPSDVEIIDPTGDSRVRPTNTNGSFVWRPKRYGKHTFRAGNSEETIWVTARQMHFFVWDETVLRKYVTHVLTPRDSERATLWRRRGVKLVNWAGGEYLSRESEFGDKAFKMSSDWVENWSDDRQKNGQDGITIDEIYVSNRPPMGELCKAVLDFRREVGPEVAILPFFSGIEVDAVGPVWELREAGVPCMSENYWGDERLYTKRWADMTLFGFDQRGGVLSQAPGFYLDEPRHGPQTADEFRADIARCRRVAPEMRGISLFNAYGLREADLMADEVIEDLFLRPVLHLHPRDGRLIVQNIGNEDTLKGVFLEFLKEEEVLRVSRVPVLEPYEEAGLRVPKGADRVRPDLPEGMSNLYEGGVFELPKNLNPLQVARCSLEEGGTVYIDEDDELVVKFRFNKPAMPVSASSVWLKGARVGMVDVDEVESSNRGKSLRIRLRGVREDRYSLRLLSGPEHFRDEEGNPLDGSGNGFCEYDPGLCRDTDHYSVDFRVERPASVKNSS